MVRRRTKKIYDVDWYCNGFLYRTTTGCDWEDVKNLKKVAKLLGETIKWECVDERTYEYRY
jgi:hypothetical protein